MDGAGVREFHLMLTVEEEFQDSPPLWTEKLEIVIADNLYIRYRPSLSAVSTVLLHAGSLPVNTTHVSCPSHVYILGEGERL